MRKEAVYQKISGDIYECLSSAVETKMRSMEMDARLAGWFASKAVAVMCHELGGMNTYFPKETARRLEMRDEEIFVNFGSAEISDLAAAHGVSEVRIYQIIAGINKKIFNEFNGANYDVLASIYGIDESRVRSIIAKEQLRFR